MLHHTRTVKIKDQRFGRSASLLTPFKTIGLVDIHFHGAFGIDVMTAKAGDLNDLTRQLWKNGIAAFCPTTLSSPPDALAETVGRLGKWIREAKSEGAKPLGIHLEGPYLNSSACGAHPPNTLRPINWNELDHLWEVSQGTLKILTLAPERLNLSQLHKLIKWAQPRGIHLSIGHSIASEEKARKAFQAGFRGVTHAWNAMNFHHRSPGILGAALGQRDIFLELIIDQIHVAPEVLRWTLDLHTSRYISFISDCTPAAGTSGQHFHSFGPLKVRLENGASRLSKGQLAGGGYLLSDLYKKWLKEEANRMNQPIHDVLKRTLDCVTKTPLRALRIPIQRLQRRQILWHFSKSGQIEMIPID